VQRHGAPSTASLAPDEPAAMRTITTDRQPINYSAMAQQDLSFPMP